MMELFFEDENGKLELKGTPREIHEYLEIAEEKEVSKQLALNSLNAMFPSMSLPFMDRE